MTTFTFLRSAFGSAAVGLPKFPFAKAAANTFGRFHWGIVVRVAGAR